MPIVLAAVGLVGWLLTSLGCEGPELVFLGVPMLLGLGWVVLWAMNRR